MSDSTIKSIFDHLRNMFIGATTLAFAVLLTVPYCIRKSIYCRSIWSTRIQLSTWNEKITRLAIKAESYNNQYNILSHYFRDNQS